MDDKLLRDDGANRQEVVFDVGGSSSQVIDGHLTMDPLYQERPPTDHGGSSPANPDGHQQFPEPFGIETHAGSSAKLAAKPNKKKERIAIGVLCVALLLAIVICVILAILLACSKSGASKNDLAATAMLSSSPKGLTAGGAESRALLRASEIAAEIGQESLVLAPLAEAVSALARSPFWQFDIKQHTGRVSSLSFAPASVPGSSSTARLLTTGSWDSTIKITRVELSGSGDSLLPQPNMPSVSVSCSGEGMLHSLAWSPSGEWLAAGCGMKDAFGNSTATVHLWSVGPPTPPGTPDLPKLTKVAEMKHDDGIKALAWAPDSSALAAGDDDGGLRVWLVDAAKDNAKGFEPEYVNLDHYGGNDIRALSWSPDGRVLASGRTDENIFLWDVTDLSDDGPWIMAKGEAHDGDIDAAAFSPDGRMLASADDEGQVLVWDVRNLVDRFPKKAYWTPEQGEDYDDDDFVDALPSLEMVHELPPHEEQVTGIVWTSSEAVATSSNDGTVRIYDIMVPVARAGNLTVTGAVRVSLYQPATEFENLAYVDTDPPLLAAGTNSGLTLGWREAEDLGLEGPESFHMKGCSAEVLRKFSEEKLSVRGSAHTEDGLRFAISSYQGNVCIWERSLSATAGPTFGWKLEAAFEITGADKRNVPCRYIEFSPSGNMLAAATDRNGVHTWRRDPKTGSWEAHHEHYHTGKVKKVAWSPDEKFLASGSMDQSVAVVEVVDKAASNGVKSPPELLERHSAPVQAVAWHGTLEGGDLVLASGSDDTTIGLWRLERGPDGSVQVKSISIVKHHDGVGVHHLAWAPGKDWLASVGGTGEITVLEGAANVALGNAKGSAPVLASFNAGAGGLSAMSWNPDGTKMAVALPDSSVRVWTLGENGRGDSTWRLEESCQTMRWLVPTGTSPERLACARLPTTDDVKPGMEPFDHLLQFILVNFEDQLTYLRRLTFGELGEDDVSMLGLQDIDAVTARVEP